MPDLDANVVEGVASTDVEGTPVTNVKKEGSLETVKPVASTKKLELTPEELDAIKADAVAQARQEQEERIRREEAERQGNYQALYEQALQDKRESDLALWRQQALSKYKLSEDLLDSLVGETEDELMKAAKKLRSSIDKEVENRIKAETVPAPDPGRVNPPRQRIADVEETTRRNIRAGLGIGRVQGLH